MARSDRTRGVVGAACRSHHPSPLRGVPASRAGILAPALLLLLPGAGVSASPAVAEAGSARPLRAVIDTVAGGGPVGDGSPARSARFNLPGGVTQAPNGDLVIVDFGNHRVRRVDHRTGVIETLAGTGQAGYNGDGIPATEAQLSRPEYAVFGPDGDLYIADSYNNRIRRIDHRSGLIETVAGTGERGFSGDGGPATEAALHFPEGIAVDHRGNLFIADTVNRRIRRVEAASGVITTYAGGGEVGVNPEGTPARVARFLRLARIAVDRAGDLYIADSPSHRILVIEAATGLLRTFAGTGTSGFSGDGGLATDTDLSYPEGVVVAPGGDVYFADVGSHRVRRIDAETGVVTTVAGSGDKGFSGDGGPAVEARLWSPGRVWVDRTGSVLIADILNARIRRVDAATGIIDTIAGVGDWGDGGPAAKALLSVPGDVVYANGKLYVADYGTRRVRSVDLDTGLISTVAGGGVHSGEGIAATDSDILLPEAIAVEGEEALYIADNLSSRVWRVDLATGILRAFAGTGRAGNSGDGGPARAARLLLPSAVSIGPGGAVYISDFGNHSVRVVDPSSGTIRAVHRGGGSSDAPLASAAVTTLEVTPRGLFHLVHGSQELRLFDLERGTLRRLPLADGIPPAPSGDSQIIDIAVHDRYVYLADALAHRILRLDLETAKVIVVAGSGAQGYAGDGGPAEQASLFHPGGVTVSDDGRELFIADTKNQRIRRVRFLAADPDAGESP